MTDLNDNNTIKFHPLFHTEEENGQILVGRQDIGSYVTIPTGAVDIIGLLTAGSTIGETKKNLEEKYKMKVEIENFITEMIKNEMVKSIDDIEIPTKSKKQKVLFSNITSKQVGFLFSKYALIFYLFLTISCIIIFLMKPNYIPHVEDFFFHQYFSVSIISLFLVGWVFVVFHELAHLFAAKSVGTEGSISIGHRLIFLVAQTNLGNIYSVPPKKRYIVYLAGMCWDIVIIFICLVILSLSDGEILNIPIIFYNFIKAIIFVKVWSIIWQFRFNMQTDIYYVFGNFFRCGNLVNDSQIIIKNKLSRIFRGIKKTEMNNTTKREMRIIKIYLPIYLIGTIVTIFFFTFRSIPIIYSQLSKAFDGILAGYSHNPGNFIDGVVIIFFNLLVYGLIAYFALKPRILKRRDKTSSVRKTNT